MSRVAIILIVGSIFIVTLSQALARQVATTGDVTPPELLLAFGLLYCAMKIFTCWLGAPRPEPVEDDEDDQHNEK
ncbi:hypothetical protein SAMN02745165_01984 [Malonomonas rubra DSM 5091]|uniref:Uncharacterized protein n=2 Tax=Malonomonas rubra TaxID=57040 RepID=A0A1M6I2F1_MALRU|nr:hypothetical protein SAMN02745165_01984 [Malonomonas rubra DSM 5091]